MNLNVTDWKPFKIQRTESQKGLFEIENCKCGSAGELDDGLDINYIGAKKSDNGVMRSVSLDGNENLVSKGHGIMFICDGEGSVGYTNYMDSDFIGSTTTSIGYDDALTETNAMFLVSVLDNEKFKYSYGRKYRKNLINTEIYLPVQHNVDGSIFIDDTKKYSDEGYVPDWQFMEDYINSLHHKPLTTKNKSGQVPDLNVQDWNEFRVGDLFDIHPTKFIDGVSSDDCVGYGYPLVVNSAENNGVAGLCDIEPTENGNIITFSDTTDGNTFFYQPEPFIGFAHVQGMYPKNVNITDKVMLFISTMLMFDSRGRYSYGRKMRRDTISEIRLKLPTDMNGNPDWQFIENYIKALPYGDRLVG